MKKRLYLKDTEAREEGNTFSVIADFEGNEEQLMDIEVNEILPILPLRNMVLFPGVFMPVSVGRKTSMKLVREAEKKGAYIGVVCQKVAETEMPSLEDLHTIGTVGKIIRILEMPDQTTTINSARRQTYGIGRNCRYNSLFERARKSIGRRYS